MSHIAILFLLLSGVASLSYQLVWIRLLGLSMGSTSASISTVLAAFFLGLAVGSYLAERITRNRIDSLAPYILLEFIIGAAGLILLPVLLHLDAIMAAAPFLSANLSVKFILTVLLLGIPTVCMGATFPVMAAILIRRENAVGSGISVLYSVNTAGAVLGAALAGFVFIPQWGLDGAVYIAVGINMFIVVAALFFNRLFKLKPVETSPAAAAETATVPAQKTQTQAPAMRYRALLVLFATGFVSIAAEVGWTKYLSIFTGTTIYGFAAILTVFLTGISVGSWAIKRYIGRMQQPAVWMGVSLVMLGSALLLTRAGLTVIPGLYETINQVQGDPWIRHTAKYMVVFGILFAPTFLFGVIFPINLKLYCGDLQGVRARIGKAYAVNTLASIVGAVAAGFWIIPAYGTDVLLTVLAAVILTLPFLFVPAIHSRHSRIVLASATVFAVLLNIILPHINYEDLINAVEYDEYARRGMKPRYVFLQEGKAGVISMVTYNDTIMVLQNNGLKESIINVKNENNVLLVESLLGLIPYFIHDDPKSAFIVGFGGGITTRALTQTALESIRVVELEPAVIAAGRAIVDGEISALKDPRVSLEFNDARNTLLTDPQRYDIIVSQPSHPWLARASMVFTRDFFALAKSRLNPSGVYGQWVNLFHMDSTTLKSLFKAFYQVFPEGVTFGNLASGDFLLFGTRQALYFDLAQIDARMQEPGIDSILSAHKINSSKDLFYYFSLSRQQALEAAGDVAPNTDLNILSEVRLSAIDRAPPEEEDPYAFLKSVYTFDVAPYFKEDTAQHVYALGRYFLTGRDEIKMAQYAAKHLAQLDPVLQRSLMYEIFWYQYKYEQASQLYLKHKQWPDSVHAQQALLLADLGSYANAAKLLRHVQDPASHRAAAAQLLYIAQRFTELAAIEPQNDIEKQWQLTGLAKTHPKPAGKQLVDLIQPGNTGLPQLEALAAYYQSISDYAQLRKTAQYISAYRKKKAQRLQGYMEEAVKQKDIPRMRTLLKHMQ
ncbi:hypothetical protein MNBD_GAMMA13-1226, partial [hydrothermal vent metagenome]